MAQIMELPTWAAFKSTCITTKGLPCQYSESTDRYELFGPDGNQFLWCYTLIKTEEANTDQTDFESHYKSAFNGKLMQIDSDGATMSRVKVAPSGWNFNLRGIEFQTSMLNSLVNRDVYNADLSDVTLKLYDSDGTLITDQDTATSSCVKTQVDIEPPYDIYVAGGYIRLLSAPSEDSRLSVIGVPDVPAKYGGSKGFVQNINLKYIPVAEGVNADGRAAKWLQYSATYHTNKLRFVIYHPAGNSSVSVLLMLETYKL